MISCGSWLNNNPSGTFLIDSGQSLGTSDSQSIVLGDVNGDGDLDKAVANGGAQGNRVYLDSLTGPWA